MPSGTSAPGRISAPPVFRGSAFAFYDQEARTYGEKDLEVPCEILNLTGNVSLKDGDIMCHCHITVADEDGALPVERRLRRRPLAIFPDFNPGVSNGRNRRVETAMTDHYIPARCINAL